MKKYLLPESGNFYKANLHCHTVLSDGCLTPEEVKKIYKNEGYSVVAYTDHDILIPHHAELSDDEFLALNGSSTLNLTSYSPAMAGVSSISLSTTARTTPSMASPFLTEQKQIL